MVNANPEKIMRTGNHEAATNDLLSSLADKMSYLQTLSEAIQRGDDRLVFQLIDNERYAQKVLKAKHSESDDSNEALVTDVHNWIAEFLSKRLIAYLNQVYPFFYFEQTGLGQFDFYFGNWWGRRRFGSLDVINVGFNFDASEYSKLERAFELEKQNKRLNSDEIDALSQTNDHLQDLIDGQAERDQRKATIRQEIKQLAEERVMPWEVAKQKEHKEELMAELAHLTDLDEQANHSYQTIKDNEKKILALSKEDTLISYEMQSIVAKFGTFDGFEEKNDALYRDYITSLIATGQVGD
ncbi:exonuclease SbcC [Ligilactobacillus saerimneri]|uniref:exonuclease SbcC n=1 Tax=Ligilactobacillus saerimneri TaxID=228229 RepID=UPI0022A7802D|nr:exonuclease SbcC [Ligilactobacillus saerimneri]MCZ0891828.1 exonuclease SbcC [Ligilactobacillus saerimneri]